MKTCTKCGESKPNNNEYFNKNKAGKDGLNSICKQCIREYGKRYYHNNKDKMVEYQRDWRERNPNYKKNYYEANKDKVRKKNDKWASENRDKKRFYIKKWRVKNREKVYQSARIRQLNKSKGDYSLDEWEQTKAYFGNRCAYCGVSSDVLSQDHFIPLSKGGSYTKDNIIPACIRCNSSKNNTDFKEWFTKQEFYNFDRLQKIEDYLKEIEYNGKTYKP